MISTFIWMVPSRNRYRFTCYRLIYDSHIKDYYYKSYSMMCLPVVSVFWLNERILFRWKSFNMRRWKRKWILSHVLSSLKTDECYALTQSSVQGNISSKSSVTRTRRLRRYVSLLLIAAWWIMVIWRLVLTILTSFWKKRLKSEESPVIKLVKIHKTTAGYGPQKQLICRYSPIWFTGIPPLHQSLKTSE